MLFVSSSLPCVAEILVLLYIPLCSGFRILSVLPFSMKSHHIMFNALFEGLVARGHEVTVYSGIPLKTNASNYKHIEIRSSVDDMLGKFGFQFAQQFTSQRDKLVFSYLPFQHVVPAVEETLDSPQVQKLIHSNQKFDVVLLETLFAQEALIAFGHKFKAPVIFMNTLGSYSIIDSVMGNPNPVSYVPHFAFPYTSELTFYQRLINSVRTFVEQCYFYFIFIPKQQEIMEKHFGNDKTLLPVLDLLRETDLVLTNTQPEVAYPRPFLPNMIEVGGLHIKQDRAPLPKNIENFMNEADNGVIYFSLGSTFSGSTVPDFFNKAFIQVFSKIPQRVLWKIDPPPAGLSNNVMPVQWAPQADILAHPKCKLFISHGGLLSLLEAVHFAVPVIGIPLFADQPMNMAKTEHAGLGLTIDFFNVSVASVQWAVNDVLTNSNYKSNMARLSAHMKDRVGSPLNTAVHWVEFVAKHQGAPQLKSPARNMSSFKYFLLDVIYFLISISLTLIFFLYFTLKFIFIKLCNNCKTNLTHKKSKKTQ